MKQQWLIKHQRSFLLALLILAAVLRFYAIDFGKPYLYHPDEIKLTAQAGRLLNAKFMDKQAFFGIQVYPPFYTYMLSGFLVIPIGFGLLTGQYESLQAVKAVFENNPFTFYLWSRILVALLGIMTIWILYRLGKKLYDEKLGLLAALLLSVNFLHVRNSHFGTVDVPATFFGVLSLYGCAFMLQDSKMRHYLLTAIVMGVAVATKFSMVFLALPFIFAHFAQVHPRQWLKHSVDKRFLSGVFTGIISLLIACPLFWLDFNETWGGIVGTHRFEQVGKIGSGGGFLSYWTGNQAPGFGVFYPNSIPATFGILLTILVIVGLIVQLVRHRKADLLILTFVLPTYFMFEDMSIKAMRHLIPLVPFFMIAGAASLSWLYSKMKNSRKAWIVIAVIVAIAGTENALHSLIYMKRLSQTDPRTKVSAWIKKNIPEDATIFVESFPPTMLLSNESRYQINTTDLNRKSLKVTNELKKLLKSCDYCYYISDSFTRQTFEWKDTSLRYPEIARDRLEFFQWISQNKKIKTFASQNSSLQPTIHIYKIEHE